MFQVRAEGCMMALVPLPTRTQLAVKLLLPVPPLTTARVPDVALEVFRFVRDAAEPENKVAVIVPLTSMTVVGLVTPMPIKPPS